MDSQQIEPDELGPFPISPSQRRFWILAQLEPGNAAYHISICLRLIGSLSRDRLERSLSEVVARHEPLRSRFVIHDSEPMLVVASRSIAHLQVLDLTGVSEPEVEAKAYSLAREETSKAFDLSRGPPFRSVLLTLAPEHHILVSTIHHIVCDGWSAELLVRELAERYEALTEGRRPAIEPLAFPYSSYAVLQHLALDGERMNEQLQYWTRVLSDAPPLLDLRPGRSRPNLRTNSGASYTVPLDTVIVEGLQRLARKQRSTLFMVLTAAFGALAALLSRRTDIVIGIPVTGRDHVETESLIGLFVNTVVLRTSFVEDPTFKEILDQTRERLLDGMAHQDVPFEHVVDAIGCARNLDYNPIFQIMFSMFKAAVQSRRFGSLTAMPYIVESGTARVDLSMNVIQGLDQKWWLQAEYRTDLFDQASISDLLAAYLGLLRLLLRNADTRLSEIGVALNAAGNFRTGGQLSGANDADPIASIPPESSVVGVERGRRSASTPVEGATHESDDIESTLIAIWSEALPVSNVQIDDDFFSVGGHSLMAISLMVKINRTYGVNLPVSLFLREPTIRQFARRLRSRVFVTTSFVPLSSGGHRAPLFFVANNYRIRHLVDVLGPDQPLYQIDPYALQEERFISGQPLLSSVDEMASHFVNQIIAVRGSGPYFLAGQCDGAIIAIEIANELKRRGHDVASPMVFDTSVTGVFRTPVWYRRLLIAIGLGALPQRFLRSLKRRIRRFRAQQAQSATEQKIWAVIWDAVTDYTANYVFDGTIVFFRATEFPSIVGDLTVGWDRVANLKVVDVPGDHERLFANREAQIIIERELAGLRAQFSDGSRPEIDPSS